jgi:hypothetical protein
MIKKKTINFFFKKRVQNAKEKEEAAATSFTVRDDTPSFLE